MGDNFRRKTARGDYCGGLAQFLLDFVEQTVKHCRRAENKPRLHTVNCISTYDRAGCLNRDRGQLSGVFGKGFKGKPYARGNSAAQKRAVSVNYA